MARLSNKDPLCRQYADAMGFFERNALMLDERIKEMKAQDGDTAELMQAKQRLMCAKEGAGRMLSDRMVSLDSAVVDPDSTLLALSKMQAGMPEGEERKQISNAITLIVRQRERLTNTDRGRRSLQKLLGAERKKANNLYKVCKGLEDNNIELRKAMDPLISERVKMMQQHAAHHCAQQECVGCPFEAYCNKQSESEKRLKKRRAHMAEKLKDM